MKKREFSKPLKYTILIIALLLLLSPFLPFPSSYSIEGLENFSPANTEYSTCSGLIPNGFIDMYEYVDGDYQFDCYEPHGLVGSTRERALIYFKYEDESYSLAKQYVFENMELKDNVVSEYGKYKFYDIGDNSLFPYEFKRVAFNDEENTLVFIGFYVNTNLHDEVDEYSSDWKSFIDEYFSEYYSFAD